MIEATAIIGHGPSLQHSGMGGRIDGYRYVVRFPYAGNWQAPADYGTRTSFVCATVGRASDKLRREAPDIGYYFYDKAGMGLPDGLTYLIDLYGGDDVTGLIAHWQKKMAALKPAYPYFSHGTAAICVMASKYPLPVTALGCDNLAAGNADCGQYIGSWYFEGQHPPPAGHDLAAERVMVDEIAKFYNLSIGFE